MADMLATPANMRKLADGPVKVKGATLIAYSPRTFEQFSATPGDYFYLPDDTPLRDGMDQPMVLAYAYEGIATVSDPQTSTLVESFEEAARALRNVSDAANDDAHVSADFQSELDACLDAFDSLHQQAKGE